MRASLAFVGIKSCVTWNHADCTSKRVQASCRFLQTVSHGSVGGMVIILTPLSPFTASAIPEGCYTYVCACWNGKYGVPCVVNMSCRWHNIADRRIFKRSALPVEGFPVCWRDSNTASRQPWSSLHSDLVVTSDRGGVPDISRQYQSIPFLPFVSDTIECIVC